MEDDGSGFAHTRVLFNTLNGAGQVTPGFQGLDQIQELVPGLFQFGLDTQLIIDGEDLHIGNGNNYSIIRSLWLDRTCFHCGAVWP